jgi:hypothetical protein
LAEKANTRVSAPASRKNVVLFIVAVSLQAACQF